MTDPVQRDDLLRLSVCHALYTATQSTLQLYRDLLGPLGLSYQQGMVLALLWQHGRATPGELADELALDPSSISGLLGRMERAGLVERATDAADRRRVTVTATDRGLQLRSEAGWVQECVSRALALDAEQAQELVGRLEVLRSTIDAFPRPATTPARERADATA